MSRQRYATYGRTQFLAAAPVELVPASRYQEVVGERDVAEHLLAAAEERISRLEAQRDRLALLLADAEAVNEHLRQRCGLTYRPAGMLVC